MYGIFAKILELESVYDFSINGHNDKDISFYLGARQHHITRLFY